MENLKKIFTCSSDSVIITDYNFNILWSNKFEEIFSLCSENCAELFSSEKLPLKSGKYYVGFKGMLFECRVINYPDCENGVYVIQTDGNDIMLSFFKCKGIRDIIENNSGIIRDAVMGISLSNNRLRSILNKAKLFSDQKYVDMTDANCCKLLKPFTSFTEMIRYTDGSINSQKLDLSAFLEKFVDESADVLFEKVEIKSDIESKLFVYADADRLEAFLISLLVIVNDGKDENNIINVSAKRLGEYVSVTISPDSCGTDNISKPFVNHIDIHKGDEFNLNLFIINCFCKAFNAKLFITENTDESRAFNVKMPFCNDHMTVKTPKSSYINDKFSKYNIMYSNILY